jgi:hypothetical protein
MSRKFFIAGVQFRPNAAEVIKNLSEGDELELELEPTNAYDANAVKINWTDGEKVEHLGYVPKKFSAEITALIETEGLETINCIITTLNPNAKKWEMCEVEVLSLEDALDDENDPDDEEDEIFGEEFN